MPLIRPNFVIENITQYNKLLHKINRQLPSHMGAPDQELDEADGGTVMPRITVIPSCQIDEIGPPPAD